MKKAIIGLATLIAGCATTDVMQGAGLQNGRAGAPVVQERSSAARAEPVTAIIESPVRSYDICNNDEIVITMDEHSYTLECGEYTFIHYQHPGQLDVNGNVVLEAACEDTLTQRIMPVVEPNLAYVKRWIDMDCNAVVDNYAAWEEREGMTPRSTTGPEEPAPDSRTLIYQSLLERLSISLIQEEWEDLYSLL